MYKIVMIYHPVKSTNSDCRWAVDYDGVYPNGMRCNGYKPFWKKAEAEKYYYENIEKYNK